ncbi:MAG: hypothetical protein WC146_01355 [Patescibacteria group bacterium]|jgi:hypothetical protein
MDIKILPSGGSNFKVNVGPGSFTRKFKSAVRPTGSSLHNLKDNQEAILKAVNKYQTSIRRGTFGRRSQISAYKQVKKLEGLKLTKDDRKEIKQLFKHLGSQSSGAKPVAVNKAVIERPFVSGNVQRALSATPPARGRSMINRDPNNQTDIGGLKIQEDQNNLSHNHGPSNVGGMRIQSSPGGLSSGGLSRPIGGPGRLI